MAQALGSSKHTIDELARMLDVSTRTVHRYILILEDMEIPVEKGFDGRLFLVPGICPLCRREAHHA